MTFLGLRVSVLAPTTPEHMVDAEDQPYFLWCEQIMSLDVFRGRLIDPDPAVRAYARSASGSRCSFRYLGRTQEFGSGCSAAHDRLEVGAGDYTRSDRIELQSLARCARSCRACCHWQDEGKATYLDDGPLAMYPRRVRDQIPFSERLRDLLAVRKPEGGQAWLAKTTGLEPSTVSRLLRDERQPALETLELLAPALGTTVEELVRGTKVADRARTGPEFIPLEQFQQAVAKLLEYEQKANDAEARLTDARTTRDEEVKQARTARAALRDAEESLTVAQARIVSLGEEVERYKTALHDAVADIWQLKAHLADIEEIVRSGNSTGRTTAVLAAIAALTGAATVSYYVTKNTKKRPKTRTTRKKP